jgi:aminomethyltransferase
VILKKTPLFDEHVKAGGRMVEFAGWHMPVQYEGVMDEHRRVRSKVGLFDVSHMGEIIVSGTGSLDTLQWLTSNDVSKLENGGAQYSLLLNPTGGVVDDIIVYCLEKDRSYLVCVNASNVDKDFNWMKSHNRGAAIENQSDLWSQIAIQGPNAMELSARVFGSSVCELRPFTFGLVGDVCVARTGYTGEDGVEVFVPKEQAVRLWQRLLEGGGDLGVAPIGLGARDTLRTEMKYSLYGQEITDETSALEAGLGWVVKFAKGDFVGRSALEEQKGRGLGCRLVGFRMRDKGIPRLGYSLFCFDNNEIGRVTSGTMSPTLNEPIGIGYVEQNWAAEGSEFYVNIRGRNVRAYVVKTPFVKRQ